MSKLIKQIHDLIAQATDLGYTTDITHPQIDDNVHMVQMVLWRTLIKDFPKNKRVRNDLLPFEVKASVVITGKIGSLPGDFEQEIEAWNTVSGTDYPISIVESGSYRRRIIDKVDPPSNTNVFATIYNDAGKKIEISPDLTPITLLYFKKPTKPVYATTGPTNGQFIYDDASSIDVLWTDVWHDYIVERSLGMFGLAVKDRQIQRAGQAPFPKEMTI